MKIIDLTLPLYTGMPVYPGDPEASVELIQTIPKEGWNMRRLEISSHDGTHVNAQVHGVENGKTLDNYPLERFYGHARIYSSSVPIRSNEGIVFRDRNISKEIAEEIKTVRPRFVGLSSTYEVDVDIERDLLQADIILFERLTNVEQLPDEFDFYGMPLNIREGDGSPVRAFAVVGQA